MRSQLVRRVACVLVAALMLFSCAMAQPVAQSYPALREGDRGSAVKSMQRALVVLRYLDDAPDGVYGPITRAAVASFQGDHLPDAGGYATEETLALLFSMAAEVDGEQAVHIAPHSGERYHLDPECWGLQTARAVEAVALDAALDRGHTPCLICHDKPAPSPAE